MSTNDVLNDLTELKQLLEFSDLANKKLISKIRKQFTHEVFQYNLYNASVYDSSIECVAICAAGCAGGCYNGPDADINY